MALAGDSANTGKAPRQTDPAAKPLLDRVLDTSEIQQGVQPISELGSLSKWTLAVVKVGTVYTLAGTGMAKIEAVPNDPLSSRNSITTRWYFRPRWAATTMPRCGLKGP